MATCPGCGLGELRPFIMMGAEVSFCDKDDCDFFAPTGPFAPASWTVQMFLAVGSLAPLFEAGAVPVCRVHWFGGSKAWLRWFALPWLVEDYATEAANSPAAVVFWRALYAAVFFGLLTLAIFSPLLYVAVIATSLAIPGPPRPAPPTTPPASEV